MTTGTRNPIDDAPGEGRLREEGFEFDFPDLGPALADLYRS